MFLFFVNKGISVIKPQSFCLSYHSYTQPVECSRLWVGSKIVEPQWLTESVCLCLIWQQFRIH